jgi:hypothetical protein
MEYGQIKQERLQWTSLTPNRYTAFLVFVIPWPEERESAGKRAENVNSKSYYKLGTNGNNECRLLVAIHILIAISLLFSNIDCNIMIGSEIGVTNNIEFQTVRSFGK